MPELKTTLQPDPATQTSSRAAPHFSEAVTKPFTASHKELQRRAAQYQRERAAVKLRAMVKQRKGR